MPYEFHASDDGVLRVAAIGDVDKRDLDAFRQELSPFLAAATSAAPLHILVDSSQAGRTDSAARQAYVEITKDSRVKQVAVVGADRYNRVVGTFVLKAIGRDSIRFFDTEEAALAWLMAK